MLNCHLPICQNVHDTLSDTPLRLHFPPSPLPPAVAWPQLVPQHVIMDCCRNYFNGTVWTKPQTCAVCQARTGRVRKPSDCFCRLLTVHSLYSMPSAFLQHRQFMTQNYLSFSTRHSTTLCLPVLLHRILYQLLKNYRGLLPTSMTSVLCSPVRVRWSPKAV
jgi:hypothetical protein